MKKESIFLFCTLTLQVYTSCTKLGTKVYDRVGIFWESPDQIAAGVAPVYSGLRNYAPVNGVYCLNETSTDEVIVPTRAGHWYDNGMWEDMWKHTWRPEHAFVAEGWQFIYGNNGIPRINSILQKLNEMSPKPAELVSIQAELKTIRTFYYYLALDLYGNVPINETNSTDSSELVNRPRREVFSYIEKELKNNLSGLTTEVNPSTYGRATQWLAQAMLAKLYLNALVYTGTARWQECIAACSAILNSNKYALEADFFKNFMIANEVSRENIFVIPFDRKAGLDMFSLQAATLHYRSNVTFGLEAGGWNGFCSLAQFYELFNINDTRRKMFLVGQQYENQIMDPAHAQLDPDVNLLLIFDPEIKTFSIPPPYAPLAGARCAKWEFNKEGMGNMSNDFAVFRLADIILMKAEAQFRNGDIADALATINQKINGVSIRSRTGLPDFSAAEMNLDGLLAERAREMAWEGWRRNDLIRFGHYTDARRPEKALSNDSRILYPIPKSELDKNPYLVQNPGY